MPWRSPGWSPTHLLDTNYVSVYSQGQRTHYAWTNNLLTLLGDKKKQAQLHNKLRFSHLPFAHCRILFPHFSTLFSNNQHTNHPTIQPSNKSYAALLVAGSPYLYLFPHI
jgi:hypothetical protein